MRTGLSLKREPMLNRIAAAMAVATILGLAGCSGAAETETERAGNRVKDDVRGARDLLRDRGITVDTRTQP